MKIARVALDVPVDEAFDFRLDDGVNAPPGALVVVPFGRSQKIGLVVSHARSSAVPHAKLKTVAAVVDDVPALAPADIAILAFCARYYQRPLGEVFATSLPPRLRQVRRRPIAVEVAGNPGAPAPGPALSAEQLSAVEICTATPDAFTPVLLQGVTGSGKTEVYLQAIARFLARGRQALFLVPEIGLTPQLEARVRARFPGARLAVAHSNLPEGERARAWIQARTGAAQIVLGTRLAVLMPFSLLGVIVVDEEQDLSYKQQDGLRYSARDVAVRRAQQLAIPIVLGSATPSLETYSNARDGRYAFARLTSRTGTARMPSIRIVDTRADRPEEGLTHALRLAIGARLERGEQSLVFINRRGFAPVLHCRACAWHSTCRRCSANLVVHQRMGELRCHHCGHRERVPKACPDCGAADLAPIGEGTQRIEDSVQAAFPAARIARVDRDSTVRRGAFKALLDRFDRGEIDILVGTQMLAKGHDYPNLTLVGVLEADSALFSADFRAAERLFAQLVQVSGRAGRGERAGEVLIQTAFPMHPLYAAVTRHDFDAFAAEALDERRAAGFPPFAHLVLLRVESKRAGQALAFASLAARIARRLIAAAGNPDVEVFDAVPARLERKAGFERAQLLARGHARPAMQRFVAAWREALESRGERQVRWALDVDPQEV